MSQNSETVDARDENVMAPMTQDEFSRVAARVRSMAGIVLEPHKTQMIYSRLSRYLRNTGFAKFSDFLDHLDGRATEDELQGFINVLTTNLTSFFRESYHFEHLEKEVLGPLKSAPAPRLRIWSAGCSSGEEPYTIALTVQATLGKIPQDVRILATDLDTGVLDRARAGKYQADRMTSVPPNMARALPKADEAGMVSIPSSLKAAIAFRRLNLLENWPMSGRFEAIFCRNVMIYFDPETKAKLIDRFAHSLTPGGILYLGHSESILGQHPKLESLGDTVYKLRGAG